MGRETLGSLHSMETAKNEQHARQEKDLQEVHQLSPCKDP